MYTKLY